MIAIKFPALHKLLENNSINNKLMQGVIVKNGYGIVINKNMIVCVNLSSFFLKDETNVVKIAEYENILNFIEGKSFSYDFWNEISKNVIISLDEDEFSEGFRLRIVGDNCDIYLENQDLSYDNVELLNTLEKVKFKTELSTILYDFPFDELLKLGQAFGKTVKLDNISIGLSENGYLFNFTDNEIFGVIRSRQKIRNYIPNNSIDNF